MNRASVIVAAVAGLAIVALPSLTKHISAQGQPITYVEKATGYAERLYILDGGYGRADDASAWTNMMTPPKTTVDIGAYAHLIKHGNDWMFFDTSTHDSTATMPEGYGKGINWRKTEKQTIAAQLKAIGITPDNIRYIGISHSHGDHTGNVEMFPKAEVLVQRREYEAMFAKGDGPMGPPSLGGPVMTKAHPAKQLDGDYDVFGDGSVVLYFTGGHTKGHQSAMVRLKNTGYVLLSGDEVHFRSNLDLRRIPRVQNANADNQWLWSVPIAFQRIASLMQHYKAQLWVHHDIADYKGRKIAPAYYE